jgi:hypothetical protein
MEAMILAWMILFSAIILVAIVSLTAAMIICVATIAATMMIFVLSALSLFPFFIDAEILFATAAAAIIAWFFIRSGTFSRRREDGK